MPLRVVRSLLQLSIRPELPARPLVQGTVFREVTGLTAVPHSRKLSPKTERYSPAHPETQTGLESIESHHPGVPSAAQPMRQRGWIILPDDQLRP